MAPTPRQAEALRERAGRAIEHSTSLIADLKALADGLDALLPEAPARTQAERWRHAARLAALDEATLDQLEALVEALADLLAGLTEADSGGHWLERQRARLAAGEDSAAA